MKLLLFLILFLLVSCASRPERHIASQEVVELGEVNASKSLLRLYPPENSEQVQHYFYLELKNNTGRLVDVDAGDISVGNRAGSTNFGVLRLGKGKYQIEVNEEFNELSHLMFSVQGKTLKNNLVLLPPPSQKKSQIMILSNQRHELKLRLLLKDKQGKAAEMAQAPEIIFEGHGEVTEPRMVEKGVWEFSVIYPELNQIFYISVRGNGAHLRRILRHQHVEK